MPLARPAPAPVRQAMRSAFEELERTITPQDSKDFQSSTIQQVRQEALDIENQLASRQCLRNMRRLVPLFSALEHYKDVAGTLCNGTPYLPWIWAPITLILRIASEYVEAFDSIIGAYSRIASSLPRFELLGQAFPGPKYDRFHDTLSAFYGDILEFHKHAYKFVRRSGEYTRRKKFVESCQPSLTILCREIRLESLFSYLLGPLSTTIRQYP